MIFQQKIPNYLEHCKTLLKIEKLSYSYEEIETMFKIYIDNYEKPNKLNLTYEELCNTLYAYSGEAFIFHLGGEWALGTTKSDKAYGTPTIIKWGGNDYPWSRISPMIWKRRLEKFGIEDMNPRLIFGKW
jgi:hypothetical protein